MGWLIFLIVWWIFYLYKLFKSLFSLDAGGFVLWLVLGGIVTWFINLICQAGMDSGGKPKYEEITEPLRGKFQSNREVSESDLNQIINEYNNSIHKIINDANKSGFDLQWFTSKFQESLGLWRRIYNFMYELSWTYGYYKGGRSPGYKKWRSEIIPLISIKTKINKWPSYEEITVELDSLRITLGKVEEDYQKTRKIEVSENNELVFQTTVKTEVRDDGDYSYGNHEEAGVVDVFKPSEWIRTTLNLISSYEIEKKAIERQSSQEKKEAIKNNYLSTSLFKT